MDNIDGHWTAGSVAPSLLANIIRLIKNNQVISTGDMTVGSGSSQFTAKVLSADEAAGYTYENIIAREDGIQETVYARPRHYYGYLGLILL